MTIVKTTYFSLLIIILSSIGLSIHAQEIKQDPIVIQFSGQIIFEEEDVLIPLPYTNIYVKGTRRGTYSELDGFFTLVARGGDVIIFSAMGFKTVEYTLPDSLDVNRYSAVILMSQDAITIPTVTIVPWPSREHFKVEFLAMDISDELQMKAQENMAEEVIAAMIYEVPYDANESLDLMSRQHTQQNYYLGQIKPNNFLNPLAWAKFIKAWKNGDFKRKK
jgi:hypothetical protein